MRRGNTFLIGDKLSVDKLSLSLRNDQRCGKKPFSVAGYVATVTNEIKGEVA